MNRSARPSASARNACSALASRRSRASGKRSRTSASKLEPASTASMRPPKLADGDTSGTSRRAASTRFVARAGRVNTAYDSRPPTGVVKGVRSIWPARSAAITSSRLP